MSDTKIQPDFLDTGDVVAIVSPSYRIESQTLEHAVVFLEKWGLKVQVGKNASKQYGPFAGSDTERLADLQEAVSDRSVKAVICSRGGYGASRIINHVDFSPLTNYPKWFAGFSDITVLHMWLNEVCGLMSVHSEMPLNFSNAQKSRECFSSLKGVLFGEPVSYEWDGLVMSPAEAEGEITGGNLSLIFGLTGTPAEPSTRGKILFIEETGEYFYHIDRMLTSLKLAGKLRNLAALLVGGMDDISDSRTPWGKTIEETVYDAVREYDYPVYFNFPAGHINDNRAFYIGRKARLAVEEGRSVLRYI